MNGHGGGLWIQFMYHVNSTSLLLPAKPDRPLSQVNAGRCQPAPDAGALAAADMLPTTDMLPTHTPQVQSNAASRAAGETEEGKAEHHGWSA